VAADKDDNNDHVTKSLDVTAAELVDASLAAIDSVSLVGPINLEDYVDLEFFGSEPCTLQDETFVSSEILLESNEHYIRAQSSDGTYVFWNLAGNFIKCDDTPELLGSLDELPWFIELVIGYEEVDFTSLELVLIDGMVYFEMTEEFNGSVLFDLNYEFAGFDGVLFASDLEGLEEEFLFFFDNDAELVDVEDFGNGQMLLVFSNGYSILVDENGDIVYVNEPDGSNNVSGSLSTENVPADLSEAAGATFTAEEVSFAFVNNLNCTIIYQAVVDDEVVLTFNSETEELIEIAVGIDEPEASAQEIYPNPSTGHLIVGGDLSQLTSIEVYDLLGRKVYEQTSFPQALINLDHLKLGTYLVRLNSLSGSRSISWVKL